MQTYRVGFDWARDRGGRYLEEGRENLVVGADSPSAAEDKARTLLTGVRKLHAHYATRWWALPECQSCGKLERDCTC